MAISHKYPLVFPKDEFKPGVNIKNICDTYGYGVIDKVIDSKITESGEEYTLELEVHSSCNVLSELVRFNIILADGQLFRINDTEYNTEDQTKTIFAKHITHDLDFDSFYDLKYKDNNKKVTEVISTIAKKSQYSNFSVKANLGRFASQTIKDDLSDNTLLEGIFNVLDKFKEDCAEDGNEVDIEVKRDNTSISFTLFEDNKDYTTTIYKNSKGTGKDTGIRLDLSKISNVEITEDNDDFCTKVIAKGSDDKVVKDITHPTIGKAGLPFWITKVVSFADVKDIAKLRKKGQAHIIVNSLNIKNIKVELAEIVGTDFFRDIITYQDLTLYDKVWVKHPAISDTYVSFRIVKVEKDIEGNLTGLEFGELNNDFVKTLKKAITKYK